MARRYPKFWNYQNWEEKKEEERRQSYLDRQELQRKEKEEQNKELPENNQEVKHEKEKFELNNVADKNQQHSNEETIHQIDYFDIFPDGIIKTEKNCNLGRKSSLKKISEYLLKENEIINSAFPVPAETFKDKSLDDVISYLELMCAGEEKFRVNVVVEFEGHKLYSLLDDRDSCYRKVYGLDYKQYLENLEDEREM